MALALTADNFSEVIGKDQLVVVDFWAEWCQPCKAIGPIIEELSTEYAGKAVVGKVDVQEQQDLAVEYGVRNIPTILFFKNGEVVDKHIGAAPKAAFEAIINKHLN